MMLNSNILACTQKDIEILVETIRKSFRSVAEHFGLTQENAPLHPSNCTENWIKADMNRGVTYFVMENENQIAGCVACEVASPDVLYLERLAVLPEHRQRGLGKALVNHVLSKARELGVSCVNIGIIAEHTELKNWYRKIGFIEEENKKFLNLPFNITFMSYKLE
jgi:GNAT superfamily N-acetyltransferase